MQISLFKPEDLPTKPIKSDGAKLRQSLLREHQYQKGKKESAQLQRKWMNGAEKRDQEEIMRKNNRTELNDQTPQTVVLVSCVSLKRDQTCEAQNLYCSDWFKKARAFAEISGDRWLILSARHGALEPDFIIEPYDQTLYGQKRQERQAWASRTAATLRDSIPPQSKIIILAGEIYREFLIPLLSDRYAIEIPLEGLGIGKQLQALAKLTNKKIQEKL
jgi:hypothetical protein